MDLLERLVVIEGLDGAGTTTQMKALGERLEKEGRSVFLTHEPTDNPTGLMVRDVLRGKVETTPSALALLFAADRDDHLWNSEYGIVRKNGEGTVVVSDRYFYSSCAYQGVECDLDFVRSINSRFPHPRFLVFIDTPVRCCMERIEKRGSEKEIFEKREFLEKVRNNYLLQLSELPEDTNLLILDGTLGIEETGERIWAWLSAFTI